MRAVPTDPSDFDLWIPSDHFPQRFTFHHHSAADRTLETEKISRERRRTVSFIYMCTILEILTQSLRISLRTNSQQSHEATLAQLVSLQNLFTEAQSKLDHLTSLAVTSPTPVQEATSAAAEISPSPINTDAAETSVDDTPIPEPVTTIEDQEISPRRKRTLEEVRTIDEAWLLTKEKVEEHETVAAGLAGAAGGLLLAGVYSILTR